MLSKPKNKLTVTLMCKIAKVSRSGFYNFKSQTENKLIRELKDLEDFELIKSAYMVKGFKKGAKSIKMTLLNRYGITMNLKKIRRLMKKYNLICPIRKANPHRRMAKAIKTSYVAPNILERKFKEGKPNQILLTDITYLTYDLNKRAYLSLIKDAVTNEIISYELSKSLELDFVIKTFNKLESLSLERNALINSDQGSHYTSISFQKIIKELGLTQSMSRRGNCWDNAPIESFFGHLKVDIKNSDKTLNDCISFNELKDRIDSYIDYYNNDRYQWNLDRLSPKQYGDKLRSKIKIDDSSWNDEPSIYLTL